MEGGGPAGESAGPARIMTKKKRSQARVLVSDKIDEAALEPLKAEGIEVSYVPGDRARALQMMPGHGGLVVRSATKVDGEFLAGSPDLQVVVRAGAGVDNIDVDEATRRGIVVMNTPGGNTRSAAEHTVALLMASARAIPQADRLMKQGEWPRGKFMGVELQGKALGLVGLGKVGRQVARMAVGLGMRVIAHDPFIAESLAEELQVSLKELDAVLQESDFISIHAPLTEKTRGLIGAEQFRLMRKGVRIVNTARGAVIDENALLEALDSGKVAGVALDVYSKEPPGDLPVIKHERVVTTPHMGASTQEAQANVATAAVEQLVLFFRSGQIRNAVNAISLDPQVLEGIEPYRELSIRLGSFQGQFLDGNPSRFAAQFHGDIFDPSIQSYLTSCALEGFLARTFDRPVNAVNARFLAAENGIAVETATTKSRSFANLVRIEVEGRWGRRQVSGTIFGKQMLRLVTIDDYNLDAILEGDILVSANEDRPGMIGKLGERIGSFGLNIANMSLGRDISGGTAVSLFNLDQPPPAGFVDAVRSIEGILWARTVALPRGLRS